MMKRIGLMAVGLTAGLILTAVLLEQERKEAEQASGNAERKDGLFAEIRGNTVRMYTVNDGRFCGYSETKTFESPEKAMEWVATETDAKMIISDS